MEGVCECMNESVNEYMNDQQINQGRKAGRKELLNECVDAWTDRRMDGWMHRLMKEKTSPCILNDERMLACMSVCLPGWWLAGLLAVCQSVCICLCMHAWYTCNALYIVVFRLFSLNLLLHVMALPAAANLMLPIQVGAVVRRP